MASPNPSLSEIARATGEFHTHGTAPRRLQPVRRVFHENLRHEPVGHLDQAIADFFSTRTRARASDIAQDAICSLCGTAASRFPSLAYDAAPSGLSRCCAAPFLAHDREFHEEDVERDEEGKFAETAGGGTAPTANMRPLDRTKPLPEHLTHVRIPPAWTEVQYNPDPAAHLQVIGRDTKGRRVALYSTEHAHEAAATKFARIDELMHKYNQVARQNEEAKKDPAKKDVAEALELIMKMGLRPGSERDTRAAQQAYGATTLEGRHIQARESGYTALHFRGKKGVEIHLNVTDPGLAQMLRERKQRAGPRGKLFNVSDAALREHVDSFDGGSFHPKDFRTRLAAQVAMDEVAKIKRPPKTMTAYKKAVRAVATTVAQKLGNTATIALQSYIPPEVFSGWHSALALGSDATEDNHDLASSHGISDEWPNARWGNFTTPLPDWRQAATPDDIDDEELDDTPTDVVAALGFDPLNDSDSTIDSGINTFFGTQDAEWKEEEHPRDETGKFTAGAGAEAPLAAVPAPQITGAGLTPLKPLSALNLAKLSGVRRNAQVARNFGFKGQGAWPTSFTHSNGSKLEIEKDTWHYTSPDGGTLNGYGHKALFQLFENPISIPKGSTVLPTSKSAQLGAGLPSHFEPYATKLPEVDFHLDTFGNAVGTLASGQKLSVYPDGNWYVQIPGGGELHGYGVTAINEMASQLGKGQVYKAKEIANQSTTDHFQQEKAEKESLAKKLPASAVAMLKDKGFDYGSIASDGSQVFGKPSPNPIAVTISPGTETTFNWTMGTSDGGSSGYGYESLSSAIKNALAPSDKEQAQKAFKALPGGTANVAKSAGFEPVGVRATGEVLIQNPDSKISAKLWGKPSELVSFTFYDANGNYGGSGKGAHQFGVLLHQLETGAGPKPTPGSKPSVNVEGVLGANINFDTLKKVGEQMGSTKGGVYEDPAGQKFYVKEQDTAHSKNEILAAALARAAGMTTFDYHLLDDDKGSASAMIDLAVSKHTMMTSEQKKAAQQTFAVQAWLANWDVAGLNDENMGVTADGKPITLDWGGSLLYRAKGEPKGYKFDDSVNEWELLRDSIKNPSGYKLFGSMTNAEMAESAKVVTSLSDDTIRAIVNKYAPDQAATGVDKITLANRLIERRQTIAAKAKAATAPPLPPKAPHNYNSEITATEYGKFQDASPTPTGEQATSITQYCGSTYRALNDMLRGTGAFAGAAGIMEESYHKLAVNLSSYLSKCSWPFDNTVVTRHVGSDYGKALRDKLKPGMVFTDRGFVSTDHWSGDLTMKIEMYKGAPAAAVRRWSPHKSEAEILLNAGCQFKVLEHEPGDNFVRVRLLHPDDPDFVHLQGVMVHKKQSAASDAEPPTPPDRGDKYTWNEGDIEILTPGRGEPVITEEQLEEMLKHKRQFPEQPQADTALDAAIRAFFSFDAAIANFFARDAEFKEEEHKRDESGKFATMAASGAAAETEEEIQEVTGRPLSGLNLARLSEVRRNAQVARNFGFKGLGAWPTSFTHSDGSKLELPGQEKWQHTSASGEQVTGHGYTALFHFLEKSTGAPPPKPEPPKPPPGETTTLPKPETPTAQGWHNIMANYLFEPTKTLEHGGHVFKASVGKPLEVLLVDPNASNSFWTFRDADNRTVEWGNGQDNLRRALEKRDYKDQGFIPPVGPAPAPPKRHPKERDPRKGEVEPWSPPTTTKTQDEVTAMTPAQFKQYFTQQLVDSGSGIALARPSDPLDIAPAHRAHVVEEFKRLARDFPLRGAVLFDSQDLSKDTGGGSSAYAQHQGASSSSGKVQSTITVDRGWWHEKTPGAFQASLTQGTIGDVGFHDNMDKPQGVIRHEYGHAIDRQMSGNWGGYWSDLYENAQQIDQFMKQSGAVSLYGLTNRKEWVAEAFEALAYGDERAKNAPGVQWLKGKLEEYSQHMRDNPQLTYSGKERFAKARNQ